MSLVIWFEWLFRNFIQPQLCKCLPSTLQKTKKKNHHGMQQRGSPEHLSWGQQRQQHQHHQQQRKQSHQYDEYDEDEQEVDEEDDDHEQCDRSSSSPSPSVEASARYYRTSVSGVAPLERNGAVPPSTGGNGSSSTFHYHNSAPQQQQHQHQHQHQQQQQQHLCDRSAPCVSSVVSDGNANGSNRSGSSSPLSETFRGDYCANSNGGMRDMATPLPQRRKADVSERHRVKREHHNLSVPRHVQFQLAQSTYVGRRLDAYPPDVGSVVRKVRKKRRKIHATVPQQQAPGGFPVAPMKLSKAYLYTARSRREGFLTNRDVVYNGTFPIDMPFCSRFKDYNYSGESSADSATNGQQQRPALNGSGGDDGPLERDTIDEGIRSYFEGKDLGSLRRRSVPGRRTDRSVLTYAIDEPFEG